MSTTSVNFDTDPEFSRGYRLGQTFTFTLGGEDFELLKGLRIGSTALDRWWPALRRMNATEEEQAAWPQTYDGEVWKKVDDDEFLEVWKHTMLQLLVPGQEAKLERVMDPSRVDPLMIRDAVDVILWATPVVVGRRPTEASSASSNGSPAQNPEPAASSSTGGSSSPAGEGSPISPSESSAT